MTRNNYHTLIKLGGLDPETRADFVSSIANKGKALLDTDPNEGYQWLVDLFVLVFETRDIREGKGEGERDI